MIAASGSSTRTANTTSRRDVASSYARVWRPHLALAAPAPTATTRASLAAPRAAARSPRRPRLAIAPPPASPTSPLARCMSCHAGSGLRLGHERTAVTPVRIRGDPGRAGPRRREAAARGRRADRGGRDAPLNDARTRRAACARSRERRNASLQSGQLCARPLPSPPRELTGTFR